MCGLLQEVCVCVQKQEKPKFVTCLMFAESGDVITGDTSGNLLVWSKGKDGNNRDTVLQF
jgi:hypothetical protein